MIHAVIVFLSLSGPLATLQSIDSFADHESCVEPLRDEAPRIREAAAHLAHALGEEIRVCSFCVLIEQGVAA